MKALETTLWSGVNSQETQVPHEPPQDWAQTAQQFQRSFGDAWQKALQNFQGLDMVKGFMLPQAGAVPRIEFAEGELERLQQQYKLELDTSPPRIA